jgi:hypothetical protein
MLLTFIPGQGATAPVGGYGGITVTQAGTKWLATPWYGGLNLGGLVPANHSSQRVAVQVASIILAAYVAGLSDTDPDN